MTDYIKREDAMKVFDTDSMIKAWHKTECIPSVDAVEVVRCRDCKHYEYSDRLERLMCGYHRGWRIGMNENDYCSYGEMKDDDKSCDTCKHYDKGWDDIICDGCTKAHSNWERKDDEDR